MSRRLPEVSSWLDHVAVPFEPPGLVPGLREAAVVGLAAAIRTTRELNLATHAIARSLVLHAGFRAVYLEGTIDTGAGLDHYVTTGAGDPFRLVRASQGFVRTAETLEFVRWLREYNVEHPDDPARVVHADDDPAPVSLAAVEDHLADVDLRWRERTGSSIVHLGGMTHMIVGDPRALSPYSQTGRSAGAVLRGALGVDYHAIALTAGSGHAPLPVPEVPEDFFESALDRLPLPSLMLPLRVGSAAPPAVSRWLRTPLRIRCVGPNYDPERAADFHLTAGPTNEAIDTIVHIQRVTPTSPLLDPSGTAPARVSRARTSGSRALEPR